MVMINFDCRSRRYCQRGQDNLSFVNVVVLKKTVCLYYSGDNGVVLESDLSSLSTDAAGQLDVLGHDGDTLGVDGAQVGVLEEADDVRL